MNERYRGGQSTEAARFTERLKSTLAVAARTHLDAMMGRKEWLALGMSSVFAGLSLPSRFEWTIYVLPSKEPGMKRVGIKLFVEEGLVDISEVTMDDPGLSFSDEEHQKFIDDEMRTKREATIKRKREAHEAHEAEVRQAERERVLLEKTKGDNGLFQNE